ncbi:MAG: hypothetical protein PHH17_02185 [Candidatus Pacebacteria bacterium]|nr:hypothetical protein [Candidatus Paceibacterota bacterium]MDD3072484.1 hypothetical protein [Candidatus Paceibacterota bacterium]MDD3729216.1 hypothetical protein [Candidatus Paceibacterota bacterium]MDD4201748.1 hypothetical protein [Candidatus Paceibacterota bacterium]MDD4466891.1 hypothetical protein [Candidatus Paceibacterota bacterium]
MNTFRIIIFYLLLFDAIAINALVWTNNKWYLENLGYFSDWFPLSKGWAFLYFALVLWVGYLTFF